MPVEVVLAFLKQWIKQHPEVCLRLEFTPENVFRCEVWNKELSRILFKFEVPLTSLRELLK